MEEWVKNYLQEGWSQIQLYGVAYAVGTTNELDEETGYDDFETKGSVSGLIISGGYSFFVNDILAFTPTLSYSMLNVVSEDAIYNDSGYLTDLTTETSGLTIGFAINIHFDN